MAAKGEVRPPGWRRHRDEFFMSGMIGSKNDDPTIFLDEMERAALEHRRRVQQMSAKERRASRIHFAYVPPPIQPDFSARDMSFLQPNMCILEKAHARHAPSVFCEHPRDEFLSFAQTRHPSPPEEEDPNLTLPEEEDGVEQGEQGGQKWQRGQGGDNDEGCEMEGRGGEGADLGVEGEVVEEAEAEEEAEARD